MIVCRTLIFWRSCCSEVFAYPRKHGGQRVLAIFNFGASRADLDLSWASQEGEVLCSTHMDRDGGIDLQNLDVRPDEGILVSLADGSGETL